MSTDTNAAATKKPSPSALKTGEALDHDEFFKIVLIGDAAVGKSSLLSKFANSKFDIAQEPTIGVEALHTHIKLQDGRIAKIHFWDSAGLDKHRGKKPIHLDGLYRNADGALLVYDISKKPTFDNLEKWRKELQAYASESIACTLVGNKCDCKHLRKIEPVDARDYASAHFFGFSETSALDGTGVDGVFENLVNQIYTVKNPVSTRIETVQAEPNASDSVSAVARTSVAVGDERTAAAGPAKRLCCCCR